LYRIAHNTVIDHYRRRKFVVSLDDANTLQLCHNDDIDKRLDMQIESQGLQEALRALTENQQQVLTLKFLDGLSTTEIAQQLGKQQSAVRALQWRGLQALAKSPTLQRVYFVEN
jgi:RNA polymerase sigma-70 factor (ECF subfamily)